LTSAAINAPRFDHVYNGTSWISRGLLVEEQRTNYCPYSESMTNATWSLQNATRSTGYSAPDGSSNATLVVPDTASTLYKGIAVSGPSTASVGLTITFSVFAKSAGYRYAWVRENGWGATIAGYDLQDGTVIYSTGESVATAIQNCGNGWFRLQLKTTRANAGTWQMGLYVTPTTSVPNTNYSGNGMDGAYFWGGQMEPASFATSYVRNLVTGSTTRSADVCQITGSDFSSFWNSSEGSFVIEYDGRRINSYAMAIHNGGSGWPNSINVRSTSANELVQIFASSSSQAEASTAGPAAGTTLKNSTAFKTNDFASSFNGASVTTDVSCIIPTVSRMDIGYSSAEGLQLNGHISRLRYYPVRIPNATLQTLST